MNLRWLNNKEIELINEILTNKISTRKWEYELRDNEEADKSRYLSNELELKIFGSFIKHLPEITRIESNRIYKYSDLDICTWKNFTISRYDPKSLNDKFELTWFSNIISKLTRYNLSKSIKSIISRNKIFATYTTQSEKNCHYMTSVYSPKNRSLVSYDKEDIYIRNLTHCLLNINLEDL